MDRVRSFLRLHQRDAGRQSVGAKVSEVNEALWNDSFATESDGASESYNLLILEQYKLYVEMTDRLGSRRGVSNSFFITLNTGVLALIGTVARSSGHENALVLLGPLCGLIAECVAWYWTVESYRRLSAAKFLVIGALEERLPASPWWNAEWKALAEGRDRSVYRPITHLEQVTPLIFAVAYIFLYLVLTLR
jgi:hypothetical protein